MFWEVLNEFSSEDKQLFLKFVWGRTRLPSTPLGFGQDVFTISDSVQAMMSAGRSQDKYLPVSHTCFFALELPRYSSKTKMSEKILYAIRNCNTVDADATYEGRANQQMGWSDSD